MTDGSVSTIGGTTNFNVPSDVTTVDGAIAAPLNFAGIDLEHVIGHYTFRAASPGRFTNTASFSVTNSDYAQSISGVLRCGTTNLSNAVVVALSTDNDYQFSGGTRTDNVGNYSCKVLPGLYAVIAVKSNCVYDFGNPPIVNVTSNANLELNLSLLPATTLISGKLADWSTTNGLPGVFGICQSADGLMAAGWTRPNGEIYLPVNSNLRRLEADSLALTHLTYVSGKQGLMVDTTQGPVTNLFAQVSKATAMNYGTVQTDTGTSLDGLRFWGGDQQHNGLQADGYSDANGNYSLGVLSGEWQCSVSDDVMFQRAYVFTEGTNSTFGSNKAIRVDFIAKSVTGCFSGWVKDQSGSSVSVTGMPGSAAAATRLWQTSMAAVTTL